MLNGLDLGSGPMAIASKVQALASALIFRPWLHHWPLPGVQWPQWPWPLTSWPKSIVSCPCSVDHSCQLVSKSIHSVSKYRVTKFGNRQTQRAKDTTRTSCHHLPVRPRGGVKNTVKLCTQQRQNARILQTSHGVPSFSTLIFHDQKLHKSTTYRQLWTVSDSQ